MVCVKSAQYNQERLFLCAGMLGGTQIAAGAGGSVLLLQEDYSHVRHAKG